MFRCTGYAAETKTAKLAPFTFERRDPGPDDIEIEARQCDTVAADHDINAYLACLKPDCTLVQVGAPEKPLSVNVFSVIWRRRNFAGSLIGGIAETQEMLDFCAEHRLTADIEMIRMDEIEKAYERMVKSDVKYRFVIDMATLQPAL